MCPGLCSCLASPRQARSGSRPPFLRCASAPAPSSNIAPDPGAEQAPGLGSQAVSPGGGCPVKSGRLQMGNAPPRPACRASERAQCRAQGGQGGAFGPGQPRKGQGRDEGRRPVPAGLRQPCCAPVWPPRAAASRGEQSPRRGGRGRRSGASCGWNPRPQELGSSRSEAPGLGGDAPGRTAAPNKRNHDFRHGC